MPERPIIVFDVNETLLDLDSMNPIFERIFNDPAAIAVLRQLRASNNATAIIIARKFVRIMPPFAAAARAAGRGYS